jgi:selenocysteine lyase/cysteine desulfurase
MDPVDAGNLFPLAERHIHMNQAAVSSELVDPWPRASGESSGIVSFRKPGNNAAAVLRDLSAAHVIARTHRGFVRLSPHFCNTDEEVDQVLDVLASNRVSR